MKTRVPKKIEPHVRQFCGSIVKGGLPAFVDVKTEEWPHLLDCYQVVDSKVRKEGGKKIHGWAIWEWPRVMIDAEFHCVWESPDGKLVDISPRQFAFKKILFLRDPNYEYEGFQVDNRRQPLRKDPLIESFINIHNQIFEEQNRGSLKFKHGAIPVTPKLEMLMHSAVTIQNQLVKRYGA